MRRIEALLETDARAALAATRALPDTCALDTRLALLWKISDAGRGDLAFLHETMQVIEALTRRIPCTAEQRKRGTIGLAGATSLIGDHAGALRIFRAFAEELQRVVPADDSYLLFVRYMAALELHTLDRHQEAREILEHDLPLRLETNGEGHSSVVMTRVYLGTAKRALGDVNGAKELHERTFEVLRNRPEQVRPELRVTALSEIALTRMATGDYDGALEVQDVALKIVDTLELRGFNPAVRALAQIEIAATMGDLGRVERALPIARKALKLLSAALPPYHLQLMNARSTVAVLMRQTGDLEGALALQEKILAALPKVVGIRRIDLDTARVDVANTRLALGDLEGSARIYRELYPVLQKALPRRHRQLQTLRLNLAVATQLLGDHCGALALLDGVLANYKGVLDAHPDLQAARFLLSEVRESLGDEEGALAVLQQAVGIWEGSLAADNALLQRARRSLAGLYHRMGDVERAHELNQRVVEVMSRKLPDGHRDLQFARAQLAITTFARGQHEPATALLEEVYRSLSAQLPAGHPNVLSTRSTLADFYDVRGQPGRARDLREASLRDAEATMHPGARPLVVARHDALLSCVRFEPAEECEARARTILRSSRAFLERSQLAPREAGSAAASLVPSLHLCMSLACGSGRLEARPSLGPEALLLWERMHGAEVLAARRSHSRSPDADPAAVEELRRRIHESAQRVARIANRTLPESPEDRASAERRQRNDLVAALEERRAAWEAMQRSAGAVGPATIDRISGLAAHLPPGGVAVSTLDYEHLDAVGAKEEPRRERRVVALCFDRTARLRTLPLGRSEVVSALVDRVRRRPSDEAGERDCAAAAAELARIVLAPVLAAFPATKTLFWSTAELLELVPLDALPLGEGEIVGERLDVVPLVSLLELASPVLPVQGPPGLLTLGGLDYDAAPAPAEPDRPTGVDRPLLDPAAPSLKRDGGTEGLFPALVHSAVEVAAIRAAFASRFPAGARQTLSGAEATKRRLAEVAAGMRYLHLATHGFYSPAPTDAVRRTARGPSSTYRTALGIPAFDRVPRAAGWVAGLSPLVLTGLALSGANRPVDGLGRSPGILTAEEILGMDLGSCELVVLSACGTALGVARSGRSHASLRAAVLGAGARSVLTSLWDVDDKATGRLMADFYRRLWGQGRSPRRALLEARLATRARGAKFHDWAGWVLTGR